MPLRLRSARAGRPRSQRAVHPRREDLEIRVVLSILPSSTAAVPTFQVYHVPGSYPVGTVPGLHGILPVANGLASPPASSFTPQQIQTAYGINTIAFGGIQGDGAGQTIAVIDAYDDPKFVDSTDPGFSSSDLAQFDRQFGLPDPPSFLKLGQDGTGNLPGVAPANVQGWATEEALDVEWAHAIAPAANIILMECNSQSFSDLLAGALEAAQLPGVSVVSMSFSFPEVSDESVLDADFQTPIGHQGVTFLASTGDNGSTGVTGGDRYSGRPAFSSSVVAVGGTSLGLNADGSYHDETGWGSLLDGASGGGISRYEPEPSYQLGVQHTGFRTDPDVAFDADPATGVAVYDSYTYGTSAPWIQVGGTSLGVPAWGGLIAIANQGRVLAGGTTLDGATQTLPALYGLPYTDFHDVNSGTNFGFRASSGYDLVTGLGSPKANLLVPDLTAYGMADQAEVTTDPPARVIAGDGFGFTVSAVDPFGNLDTQFNGTATLSLSQGPSGGSFAPVTVPVQNGVAVFDNLSLGQVGNGYQFQVIINSLTPVLTPTFDVISDPTPGSGTFYPAPTDASLRAAIAAADSNSSASNTIVLSAGTYALTNTSLGQLVVENASDLSSKTLTIVGQGMGQTVIEPVTAQGWKDRIFEVISTPFAQMTVIFQDLTIAGGFATGGGILGGAAALGGGVLIDGGRVAMTRVAVLDNVAAGNTGASGAEGAAGSGNAGGPGKPGSSARGGGLYLASGSLTLTDDVITANSARGGAGGTGGRGGTPGPDGIAGRGGDGGAGGSASGGGAYVAGGSLAMSSDTLQSNSAQGGSGGIGGTGGHASTGPAAGNGGDGGLGGPGAGGGLYLAGGSLTVSQCHVQVNRAAGGTGGILGVGGTASSASESSSSSVPSLAFSHLGQFGDGGSALGGGLFVQGGAVTLTGAALTGNRADGGRTAFSGSSANSGTSSIFAGEASAGEGFGGAVDVAQGTVSLSGALVAGNSATFGGGIHNSGSVVVAGTTLANNTASRGGAVWNGGSLLIATGSIVQNSAGSGGGILNSGTLTITGATISNNRATDTGGGITNSGTLTINAGTFQNNVAVHSGGAISNQDGTVNVSHGAYDGNSSPYGLGGAFANAGGIVSIDSATITNNSAFQGGGIDSTGGQLSMTDSTISGNSAYEGAGIFNESALEVLGTTIAGNSAFLGGGIANNFGGTLWLVDSTLAINSAVLYGGGIDSVSTLTILSSTIAYNSVGRGGAGGGLDAWSGTAVLDNTIVALNAMATGSSTTASDISGTISPASAYNLIGTGGSGGLADGVNHNLVGVSNPGLAPGLADNGGPTQTIALLSGSPAIGAGTVTMLILPDGNSFMIIAYDQRGVARPGPGFDIGAYQTEGIAVTPAAAPRTGAAPALGPSSAGTVSIEPAAKTAVAPAASPSALPMVPAPSPFQARIPSGHRRRHAATASAVASSRVARHPGQTEQPTRKSWADSPSFRLRFRTNLCVSRPGFGEASCEQGERLERPGQDLHRGAP
ncbi:MAG TPA: choice-of-anchor Q domain-containing protein [Isosphaeraceae bacterium]|nr:choice-of-anchor Q domain-containing protein [Isosphaeraceae bacterium]